MKVIRVSEYNNTIARNKWEKCDKTKAIASMFFFYLRSDHNNRYGYCIQRKKGWVAYSDTKAVFDLNKNKAIKKFNN